MIRAAKLADKLVRSDGARREEKICAGDFRQVENPVGYVRLIHEPHPPRFALRASLGLSKFVPDEFVEPTVRLHARLISSQVHSTTLPPLRKWAANHTGTLPD